MVVILSKHADLSPLTDTLNQMHIAFEIHTSVSLKKISTTPELVISDLKNIQTAQRHFSHLPILLIQPEPKNPLQDLIDAVDQPLGSPVAVFALGKAGLINAGLFSASILGLKHKSIAKALLAYRQAQTEKVLAQPDPSSP